jgi:ATP-binding cassette subfamily B protein/subfamily B ATP-binding cassette protein MsbA
MSIVFDYFARLALERAGSERAIAGRLLGEFRPYTMELAAVLLLSIIVACAQAASPWFISRAINHDILNGNAGGLAKTMMLLLAVYLAETLVTRTQMLRVTAVGQQILASLRGRVFEQYMSLPLSYFQRRPIGDLMSRVTADMATLDSLLSQSMAFLPGLLFGLIGTLIAMLMLNARLALASFVMLVPMVITTAYFARRARKAFRAARKTTGDVTARLQEEIVGVREAQAFNRVEINIKRFREQAIANRNANVQAVGIASAFSPTFDVLSTLGIAIVIGYGASLVIEGYMTVGLLAAFLLYVQRFYYPIQVLSQIHTQMQSAIAGAERIYAVLDEQREDPDPLEAITLKKVRGRIEFRDVSFAYEPGQPVLHNISFRVEPGQTVALVGPTGAGKTTIANLIARFLDATEGAVRVDGYDVRDLNRKSLRKHIAAVLQEPFLLSGSVEENIGYGRLGATHREIEEVARLVGAHSFIEALPQGYDTPLGEQARIISQGQRQLLSIARAALADPRILILDEATSAVDSRTEAIIQSALRKLFEGRTSIVIAHRLNTVRSADLILVIEGGRLVGQGTHQKLLEHGGLYAELYSHNFRHQAVEHSTVV